MKEPFLNDKIKASLKQRTEALKKQKILDARAKIPYEITIKPTIFNKIKLFFVNIYEIFFICMGIIVALGQDDLTTLVYQIIMQIMLALSKIKMGKYTKIQKYIAGFLIFILLVTL